MDFSRYLNVKRNFNLSSQATVSIFCPLIRHSSRSQKDLPSIHELGILPTGLPKSFTSSQTDSNPLHPAIGFYHSNKEPLSEVHHSAQRRQVSNLQREKLNRVFKKAFFPSTEVRAQLAHDLDMTPRAVQVWFQNKRQAWRSKHKASLIQINSAHGPAPVSYIIPYFDPHSYNPLLFMPLYQANLLCESPHYL